jgi:uncharacterized protein involved in exopolysaccharide biosynthesis
VEPIDEIGFRNSVAVPSGQIMSREAPSMAREAPTQEDIALTQSNAEIIPSEKREHGLPRERAVTIQRLVWGKRRFVVRSTVAGLLLSTLIAFSIPKRFQSTARLMPPDQGSSGMGLAMLAASGGIGAQFGSVAGDLLGLKSSSDLFIGVLQSRTVQDDLINKFDLKKVYSEKRMEDAREDLDKRTDLSADRKSGIITIQVVDNNPKRAAAMAGEYVNELNLVVTQLNTSSARRERVFLEDRLAQVKQDLESAEKSFSEFASKNTALDIPEQGKAMIEAAATLEGQLIAAQTELQGLKQMYSDGNVRVRATQARVDEIQRQLQKLDGKVDDRTGQVERGDQGGQSMYPSIRQLPLLGVSYADLYRTSKVQETVFETLTQEYEVAKVQEAKETPSVKVLDPPDIPEKKSFPPRLLIMALGTMLAIAASVTWVLGKQTWNQVEPGDPQKVLAQEIIHTVRARMLWVATNGSGRSSISNRVWGRFRRRQHQTRSET